MVTTFRQVERATADRTAVAVTVWRGHQALTISSPTVVLSGTALHRIVEWAGATLQARWAAVMRRGGEWASEDEFKIEAMAIFSLLGIKMGKRAKSLRAGGFDHGEPVQ